ncbi:HXXXD-type acyl-transferase family protein [Abeliophyllum distichum]|uniref:HXXXD-type acyl-transferase family protein n=1 Tax=Abeliophyllum distichum TaxID=126358 RepID=A0ABD1Q1M8_9LAMI
MLESSQTISPSTATTKEFLLWWPKLKVRFSQNPDLHLVQNFLPNELGWILPGSNVSMIQVNHFDCGGMVIGIIVSHGVAYGLTLSTFLKAWAATTAGRFNEAVCPNCIAQSRSDKISTDSQLYYTLERFLITGNYIIRRYIFDSSAISMLKEKIRSSKSHTD